MILSILLSGIISFGSVEYDPDIHELMGEVNSDTLSATLASLSGEIPVTIEGEPDSIPCRFALSEGSDRAALWLAEQFESRGFEVELVPFLPSWFSETRPLPLGVENAEALEAIYINAQSSIGSDTMYNVVATLPGKDSLQVILCAHYDAFTFDAMWTYTPGADDNASGVATVLETARVLGAHDWQHTLRFVLFSGEELGLWGSEAYVKDAVEAGDNMIAALNMDMIAYNNDDVPDMDIHCNPYDAASQDMGQMLIELIDIYELDIVPDQHIFDATDRSDHYWFWQYNIPAALLIEDFDDFNPFFHTTNDRLSKLDTAYMAEAVRLALGWAASEAGLVEEPGIRDQALEQPELVSLRLSSAVVHNHLWLEISSPHSLTPVIYDASGQRVKTLETIQGSSGSVRIPIEVSDLPRGVYWITVSGKDSFVSERFVLVR